MKNPAAKRWLGVVLVVYFLCGIAACSDELLDSSEYELGLVTASPDISLPLAYGELGLSDLLVDSTYLRVYPDGLIYLSYEETQSLPDIRDLMLFADRTFEQQIPILPAAFPATAIEVERASIDVEEDFGFPQLLKEIAFKETTSIQLGLNFEPFGSYDFFAVEISLPTFTKDGVPFVARVDASQPIVLSLGGYVANLDDNVFPMSITLIEKPHTSSEAVIVLTDANVSLAFDNFDFEYIKGFFGELGPIEIEEQVIGMEAFGEALGESQVSFANPQLTFSIISDFGLPINLGFTPLEVRKKGESLPILFTVPNPVEILAPAEIGETARTDIGIANLAEVFDFVPDEIAYGLSMTLNEGLTDGLNFMHDTSRLRIRVHAELPLHGRASNIVLKDTFEIDMTDAKESQVVSASLRIRAENELPLGVALQFYFANENSVVSDSLFSGGPVDLIEASTVTSSGELLQAGSVDQSIELDEQKLKSLFDAKRLIVRATMNTSLDPSGEQNHVQFKSGYKINLNLGFQAKLKLESEL